MEKALQIVAELMALAARTAPKAIGKDYLEIKVLSGKELLKLAQGMLDFGKENNLAYYNRDGDNVRRSEAVLLLSLRSPEPLGLNCGACGFSKCSTMSNSLQEGPYFSGPVCAMRLLDLGIALGSAAKTASLFNADSRIMFKIGVVARKLKMIDGEVAIGIPISGTGKSIYFDRPV